MPEIRYTLYLMDHDIFGSLGYKKAGTYYRADSTMEEITNYWENNIKPIRGQAGFKIIFHKK